MNVVITKAAQKQFIDLPILIKVRVRNVFMRLQNWPDVSGYKKLSGVFTGYFRIRTGDYRIIFSVAMNTITIYRIGHRDKVYKWHL